MINRTKCIRICIRLYTVRVEVIVLVMIVDWLENNCRKRIMRNLVQL